MKTLINILVLVAMLFVATVSVASACDPRYGYCPPAVYNPPVYPNEGTWASEWSYAVERTTYDVNYAANATQRAYNQAAWVGEQVWNGATTYPYNW